MDDFGRGRGPMYIHEAVKVEDRYAWKPIHEFDQKDLLYVRIDKRRKMLATVLLKALGYSVEEMLNYFYPSETITIKDRKILKSIPFKASL